MRKYRKYIDGSVLLSSFKGMHSNIEGFVQEKSGVLRLTNVSKGSYHYERHLATIAGRLSKVGYAIINVIPEIKQDEIHTEPTMFLYIEAVPSSWVKPVTEKEEA